MRAAKTIILTFIGNPHLLTTYAVNFNQHHSELQYLVERVMIELELMNVAKKSER